MKYIALLWGFLAICLNIMVMRTAYLNEYTAMGVFALGVLFCIRELVYYSRK